MQSKEGWIIIKGYINLNAAEKGADIFKAEPFH